MQTDSTSKGKSHVLLVDDHPGILQGLAALINATSLSGL